MRDIDTIDSEVRLVAALRVAARERSGPLPSIAVADALLDERRLPASPPGADKPRRDVADNPNGTFVPNPAPYTSSE
jgi:hypothetical protein